jgi:hypothetical protein
VGVRLRPVTTKFLESAPLRIVVEQRLAARPAAVFRELTDDASTWPSWFREVRRAAYTGPGPYGVGAGRSVTLFGGVRFVESVQVWEESKRFVYRVEETNLLGAHAWMEEWLLAAEPSGGTVLRFTMALEAHAAIDLPLRATGALVARSVRRAMSRLDSRAQG